MYEAGRASARPNYEEIVARSDAGEDVTELVLSRLLPHTDSVRHRERGDWVHVAPAIQADVQSWFEGIGWASAQDWPARASHILHFVRRAIERPADLGAACADFAASPMSKGLQSGMMTPVLNALRPESYAIVNSKVAQFFEALTDERLPKGIAEYPGANARILGLIEANSEVFARAAEGDITPLEAFDMMAHWYVALRDAGDGTTDAEEVDAPEWEVRHRAGVDRTSPGDARRVLEAQCPDAAPRAVALDMLSRSIRFAHGLAPSAWSVTLKPRLIRLNVGGIFALDIRGGGLCIVVHQPSLERNLQRRLADYELYTFSYVKDAVGYLVPYDELDPIVTQLFSAHEHLIRLVAEKTDRAPSRGAHSPGILEMLRGAGYEVPAPAYVRGSGVQVTDPVDIDKESDQQPEKSHAPVTHPTYTLEDAATETHLELATLAAWARAINRKGQAIVYGPPGTGKTYVAERLRRYLLSEGDGHTDLVQFHSAYSYEDFIQGLRPHAMPDGTLTYRQVAGRFMDFCEQAAQRTGVSVLIIDEINRANLSQVFGELMYLLEYRDRDLPLAGGGRLRIPPNVRIIGTMNTADRSIALVDHALRRRFAFLRLDPNLEVLRRFHAASDYEVSGLARVLEELNTRIADPHYSVGISFFLRTSLPEELEAIWAGEIEPYIEELFFDRKPEVDRFRWAEVRARIQPRPIA